MPDMTEGQQSADSDWCTAVQLTLNACGDVRPDAFIIDIAIFCMPKYA